MTSKHDADASHQSVKFMISDLKSLLAGNSRSTELSETPADETGDEAIVSENYFTFLGTQSEALDTRKYSSEKLQKFFNIKSTQAKPEDGFANLRSDRSLTDRGSKIRRLVMSKISDL